jgi:hypothetical protein
MSGAIRNIRKVSKRSRVFRIFRRKKKIEKRVIEIPIVYRGIFPPDLDSGTQDEISTKAEKAARTFLEGAGHIVCRFPSIRFREHLLYAVFSEDRKIALCPHIKCRKNYSEIREKCPYLCPNENNMYSRYRPRTTSENRNPQSLIGKPAFPQFPCFGCMHDPDRLTHICKNVCASEMCQIPFVIETLFQIEPEGSNKQTTPDFLTHFGGKHYVFEVKTGRSHLTANQRKFLIGLQRIGFEPKEIRASREVSPKVIAVHSVC